jgi:hypothetical protein
MSGKSQLISSKKGQKMNSTGKWYVHDEVKPFIMGIETGNILENVNAEVLNSLISGVPSPWARAKLFWYAFHYLQAKDANIKTSGLIEFYKLLAAEWKGMIAVIALFGDRITFSDPITMDGDSDDLHEITSGFGRMLFEDSDLWCDQEKVLTEPDEKPYLQLIYYNNQLIGATSPFSIFFSGVDYSNLTEATDIKWYRGGKFEDPLRFLDRDKMQKLFLFIKNINQNFAEFEKKLNLNRGSKPELDLNGLKKILRDWQIEIGTKEKNLDQDGTIVKYPNLNMPFKSLLSSQHKVYKLSNDSLTAILPKDTQYYEEIPDLQSLLKEDKVIVGWYESGDKKQSLANSAVYYLKVNHVRDKDNPVKYFALPLSLTGIDLYKNSLSSLLDHSASGIQLSGAINDQGRLVVNLTVVIDGRLQNLNPKEYEIEWRDFNSKVLIWPNFISDNWDSYYLYSEYPTNQPGIKFIPFFKQCETREAGIRVGGQKYLSTSRGIVFAGFSDSEEVKKQMEEDRKDVGLEIINMVTYPAGLTSDMPRYEILKSNRPIAGLEIRIDVSGRPQIAGYLIVKNPGDDSMGSRRIIDLTTEPINDGAIVGIDFGSNNSCVHYSINNGSGKIIPIPFKNRRLALVGIDSENNSIANKDELLFFSNEETKNGQIKSWLHSHDLRYVGNNGSKEIAGGVPVNKRNIQVKDMDKDKITTQAGILFHNMKWFSDANGIAKKTAYLKTVWLQTCADLYAVHCKPVELRWSYPGSMTSIDSTQYNSIYNTELPHITPIMENGHRLTPSIIQRQTEAEAVCKYALGQNYGLTGSNIFLGIDVGGSTSDILILSKDLNDPLKSKPKLFKQSSVRIAAGAFFDAIIKSNSFRKALYKYHESQNSIRVENIREVLSENKKAPYYLNSVFDQLKEKDFALFYTHFGREASFVFALPAFVTGLLLYYSGKLVSKTIADNDLKEINLIELLPFGKGGRLFYWLRTFPGKAMSDKYFEECFFAGFGKGTGAVKFRYRDDIAVDNKSEVSIGLALNNDLIYDPAIRSQSDIFAEKGLKFRKKGTYVEVGEDETVTDDYIENIFLFQFPDNFLNFEEFLNIFIDFIGKKTGLVKDIAALQNRNKDLKAMLAAFIENDPEYKKAQIEKEKSGQFEYKFPFFIAEGLCYLERILIPEVFKA